MDAANAVLDKQKSVHGIYNIGENMAQLAEKGAVVRVCNLCLQVRGTMKNMMKAKFENGGIIKRAGTPDLAAIIDQTDRFLVVI